MAVVYGYISNYDLTFREVGTELGAKNAATRNGSTRVGYRSNISNMYIETHIRNDKKGKWEKV